MYSGVKVFSITSGKQVAESDATMSLAELCNKGDFEGVKAALQNGADVNSVDSHGCTGLFWAVYGHHNSMVELLLNTPNIDVDQKDRFGNGAVHAAVVTKNMEALKLLLNVPNFNANSVGSDDMSALHLAVVKDINNIEALKLLLNVPNIDLNIVNSERESVLHFAVRQNNIEALELLLNVPNIGLNIVYIKGESVLHGAVKENNIEALKLLVSHPGLAALTLNMKSREGATAVMLAVMMKRLESLALLAADPRVDLDTDFEGRSLEEIARWLFLYCSILSIMFIGNSPIL